MSKNPYDDNIKEIIEKNKKLVYKKGLLSEILSDRSVKAKLKLAASNSEKLLDANELFLLNQLIENNFNIDNTIEKMFSNS